MTEKDGIGLFFFSGHGYQLSQETKNEDSYLIPTNFKPLNKDDDLFNTKFEKQTVALSEIIDLLNTRKNQDKNIIVVLDACRGDGDVKGISSERGEHGSILYGPNLKLSPGFSSTTKVGIPPNFILSFATEPGNSSVGLKGDLSDYVKLLTKYLPRADLSIYDVFDLVNKDSRRQAEGMEQKFQIATFLRGEDQRGFFKETYLSGRLPIIAPPIRP